METGPAQAGRARLWRWGRVWLPKPPLGANVGMMMTSLRFVNCRRESAEHEQQHLHCHCNLCCAKFRKLKEFFPCIPPVPNAERLHLLAEPVAVNFTTKKSRSVVRRICERVGLPCYNFELLKVQNISLKNLFPELPGTSAHFSTCEDVCAIVSFGCYNTLGSSD